MKFVQFSNLVELTPFSPFTSRNVCQKELQSDSARIFLTDLMC